MHQSFNSSMPSSFHARPHPQDPTHSEPSITYLHPNPQESIMPSMQYPLAPPMWDQSQTMRDHPQACSSDAMQWSIWSVRPDNQYRVLADSGSGFSSSGRGFEGMAGGPMIASTLDTLQIHQVRTLITNCKVGICGLPHWLFLFVKFVCLLNFYFTVCFFPL